MAKASVNRKDGFLALNHLMYLVLSLKPMEISSYQGLPPMAPWPSCRGTRRARTMVMAMDPEIVRVEESYCAFVLSQA